MKKALFLDRDGVVIPNIPYNKDEKLVTLAQGAAELINEAHQKNYAVVLVTNQSGLGRGWITWDDYHRVTDRMLALLKQENAYFDAIKVAPYYDKSEFDWALKNPEDRKPNPGMILKAKEELNLDLQASIMIGDRASDILAAQNAGISRKVLLKSADFDQEVKSLNSEKIKYETLDSLSLFQL